MIVLSSEMQEICQLLRFGACAVGSHAHKCSRKQKHLLIDHCNHGQSAGEKLTCHLSGS
jgi:hypothetical protein